MNHHFYMNNNVSCQSSDKNVKEYNNCHKIYMHKNCMLDWLNNDGKCPVCEKDMKDKFTVTHYTCDYKKIFVNILVIITIINFCFAFLLCYV